MRHSTRLLLLRTCGAAVLLAGSAGAQQASSPAGGPTPPTRAAELEMLREQKAARLQPDEPGSVEHVLDVIKDKKILERVTNGVAGFRAHLGGLITGSGFAVGPEYYRHDLAHNQIRVRASARASLRKFYLMDAGVSFPSLADNHLYVDLYGVHRNYPHIDYYGPGSGSFKSGRSGYQLEDTSFELSPGIKPAERLRIGALGRYYLVNVSRGRDPRFVSADAIYSERTTPGIQFQTNFMAGGGYIQYDWRDNPGGPRRGGNYIGRYTSFTDVGRGGYSFSRVDLEAQQYIPFLNQRRVIALRGRVEAAEPHRGQEVPFYLQPTLGGSEDLRGFRPFRYYDNNAIVLNAEYRWEVFSGLDMAIFADAGRVFSNWRNISVRALDKDFGFGFRFNVRNDVFMRIDTGFSREGFQTWVKFNNVF